MCPLRFREAPSTNASPRRLSGRRCHGEQCGLHVRPGVGAPRKAEVVGRARTPNPPPGHRRSTSVDASDGESSYAFPLTVPRARSLSSPLAFCTSRCGRACGSMEVLGFQPGGRACGSPHSRTAAARFQSGVGGSRSPPIKPSITAVKALLKYSFPAAVFYNPRQACLYVCERGWDEQQWCSCLWLLMSFGALFWSIPRWKVAWGK